MEGMKIYFADEKPFYRTWVEECLLAKDFCVDSVALQNK